MGHEVGGAKFEGLTVDQLERFRHQTRSQLSTRMGFFVHSEFTGLVTIHTRARFRSHRPFIARARVLESGCDVNPDSQVIY